MASAIVARVNADPCVVHVRKLAASELEALIYCILRHVSLWSDGEVQQVDLCVALIQNVCFIRSIPLFEASDLVYAIRDSVLEDFRLARLRAGSDGEFSDARESYERFFDLLAFELLKGY